MDILFDIIMPAHNAALTIQESIESVQSQCCTAWRLWIVDDGSCDTTVDIVRSMQESDNRIQLFRQENKGVSSARNLGMAAGSAPYIAFLDADDVWCSKKLTLQLESLQANPETGATITWLDKFSTNVDQHSPHTRYTDPFVSLKVLLVFNVIGNGSNLVIRRKLIDTIGGFNEALRCAEDWEFAVRVCAEAGIANVTAVGGLYRQSATTASRTLRLMDTDHKRAINALRHAGVKISPDINRYARFVHSWYLARQSLAIEASATSSTLGFWYLCRAWLSSRHQRHWRNETGMNKRAVLYVVKVLLQQITSRCRGQFHVASADRLQYENTGMYPGTGSLENSTVLSALIEDAGVFREELKHYKKQGIECRVPYLLTNAIRTVSFDPHIVAMIEDLYGKNTKWVMWGANIRDGVPNKAECWHVDSESRYWETVTVVLGLEGCDANNSTCYIPCSHRHGVSPSDNVHYADTNNILNQASLLDPRSDHVRTFQQFGNGRFYAFDAAGWHSGDPGDGANRTLLFLHYQRAKNARVPYMDNYMRNTWQTVPAPYLSSDEKFNATKSGRSVHSSIYRKVANVDLQTLPPELKPYFSFEIRLKKLRQWCKNTLRRT